MAPGSPLPPDRSSSSGAAPHPPGPWDELSGGGADLLREPTARGASRIFVRFVLVAVGVNALVGAAVVAYNVYDSLRDTRDRLEAFAETHARTARRLRRALPGSDETVAAQAARTLDVPLALLDRQGSVAFATHAEIHTHLPRVYAESAGRPRPGLRVLIAEELGLLSGGWHVSRFSPAHDLLVVVIRRPEEEGLAVYMTIAAGLTGMGIAVSFLIMLAAANWMLRRPLGRLVSQLTGALALDVQRRREAEQRAVAARREAEQHLAFMNSLIDASEAVGIVATDEGGVVQIFNRAASRILGYEAAEVVGKRRIEDLRGARPTAERDPARPILHPGEGEESWAARDGTERLLLANAAAIVDGTGKELGRLIAFIDVTKRRQLEAELQLSELQLIQSAKLATLGEMATGIAHELNQPLNNIGLLASRMQLRLNRAAPDPAEQEFYVEKLEKVRSQVERAGKIIDHLRAFGRPTARQLSPVPIAAPIEGVMVFLREQLTQHGIEVLVDLAPDLPAALADEARLEQVLMNLILNARDALDAIEAPARGEPKRITVRGRATRLGGGEPGVTVEVIDNGPGMSPDVRDRVFEPFFTTKEVGKGTGLGLSISYGLVREFGGEIGVQSEPGAGTTFAIRLKAAAPPGTGAGC